MDAYVNSLTGYLLAQSWQIALLAAIVALISFALQNRSAHIRYLLWLIVLAKCIVPPLYSVPVPVLPERPLIERLPSSASPQTRVLDPAVHAETTVEVKAVVQPNESRLALPSTQEMAIFAWLTGMLLFLLWVGSRVVRYHLWLHRRRRPVPSALAQEFQELFVSFKLKKSPKIWLAGDIAQPFVWGLFRGSVYLPADFAGLGSTQHHRTVLVHELSHIARFDAAVNLIQILAQGIFWFHPFVWWVNKKIRQEREKCCDEMAVAQLSTPPENYTDAIIEALAAERRSAHPVPSLAIVGSVKDIEERIRTMMRPGKKFYKYPTFAAATVVVLMALLTVPTALVLTARAGTKTKAKPDERPTDSLAEAVLNGDINQVRLHLSAGAALDAKDNDNRDRTALHHAAREGHTEIARLLIAQGADVNAKDRTGDTPLHTAIQKNQIEIANLLILKGADVNAKCEYGSTPVSRALMGEGGGRAIIEFLVSRGAKVSALHLAAYRGDIDKVRRSLEEGTNVDVRDEAGHTPLSYAASAGQMHVVEFLVSKGAEVDAKDNRHRITPLCYAANAGWRNVTELLVAKGADVNAKVRWGQTLVCYPVRRGHKEVVELLIDKGADVNAKRLNYPPLYWAIWSDEDRGSWDMTELLVRKGADVTFKAENDWPYLHYIAETNDREVAELLLAHGAKLNAKDGSGRTALHIALSSGRRDMAEFLVSKGATGPELHLAACIGNLKRVKSLLEGGTNVDTTDEAGYTALYWATSIGREEVAGFLISKGADVHARVGDDLTPLHSAAQRGHKDIVELLIAAGADVNARRASGGTPLHNAAWAGQVDVVEVLLAHGADVNAKRDNGKTALSLAKEKGHTEIVELLRKHGAKE